MSRARPAGRFSCCTRGWRSIGGRGWWKGQLVLTGYFLHLVRTAALPTTSFVRCIVFPQEPSLRRRYQILQCPNMRALAICKGLIVPIFFLTFFPSIFYSWRFNTRYSSVREGEEPLSGCINAPHLGEYGEKARAAELGDPGFSPHPHPFRPGQVLYRCAVTYHYHLGF